jgi:hypothetical protein
MTTRRSLVPVLVAVFASAGASYRTTNFLVEAASPQVAEHVGKWAEYYRKEKALQWLGREMPPWPEPCPLRVSVTMNGAGGATSFNFTGGQVWQTMHIEGPLERLVASVLPHEITHTVFAEYFRRPVPRWADEGGAVLSEDDLERSRHDQMVRQILNSGRAIPLGRLFALREYPRDMRDVGSLYAEGYSVADFLVDSSNRRVFLDFVAHGMQYGWDSAAQTHYRYLNVNQLEQAWLDHLAHGKRQPASLVARNTTPSQVNAANRVVVRLTAPPMDPLGEPTPPVVRAQAPDVDQQRGWSELPRQQYASRQGYVPDYQSSRTTRAGETAPERWHAPAVRLGVPQFDPMTLAPSRKAPPSTSPVGYPD